MDPIETKVEQVDVPRLDNVTTDRNTHNIEICKSNPSPGDKQCSDLSVIRFSTVNTPIHVNELIYSRFHKLTFSNHLRRFRC